MGIRTVVAASAVLALATSTAACSSSASSSASAGKVSLSYGVWDATQVPAMQKIIAAFEAQNPAITVTIQQTPWADYWTKLQAAASGGSAPDVFWMNGPNFQLYAANHVLRPLTGLHPDTSVYPSALAQLYQYQGVQYGLPKDFDTVGLWYNKAIFDAAGVAYPTAAWTWADFQAAAKKLTDPAKGVYGVGANLEGQENYYDTIYQAGGYVISPDGKKSGYADPAGIAGLKFWTDLVAAKESPSLKQMTDTAPLNLFESGKLAMYWGGSWDAKAFAANDVDQDRRRRDRAAGRGEEGDGHPRPGQRRLRAHLAPGAGGEVRRVPRLAGGGADRGRHRDRDPGIQRHTAELGQGVPAVPPAVLLGPAP